jgi:hypothetical protein
MEKIWIIPICLVIVGIFGSLWIYQATDIKFDFTMDNNTRIAIESLNQTINNLEIPNTKIYGVEDCQFITERQEYWCVDVAPFQNSKGLATQDSFNKGYEVNQR